ncbi:MAG: hypothetical protein ACLQVF_40510 [Isosphaeraceae bacterium]
MQPSPSAAHGAADTRIRRALRVTTNLLAGLSLVLCVASVALCVRSHRVRDIVVPYWFLAAVFALPPVAWLIRTRRRFGLLAAGAYRCELTRLGLIDRRAREVASRLDAFCALVAIDSWTAT